MRTIFDVRGPENNKSLSRQGLGRSPLESVAALSLFLRRISVVPVYLYVAATTPDPAGRDPRHSCTVELSKDHS